jgi:MFS transporter, MHS family, citrate/tricarballylate:H+ symporter
MATTDRATPPSGEAKDEGLTAGAVMGATIGNMLEFYDFVTYSFFATQIGHAFFPAKTEFASLLLSLATFGAGFVTRPIGAVIIGSYSDRAGRRPAMTLSFAMMGVAILVLAITPSYETIGVAAPIIVILARLAQGFSLGGEVGPTTAYLMEAAPARHRGLAVSFQPASQQIAATAGALVGEILSLTMTSDALDTYGWRIAFLLGAVTIPFGLWVRRGLPETLHLPDAAAPVVAAASSGLGVIRDNFRIIALALLVLAAGTISTYVFNYITTFAQHTLHMAPGVSFLSGALGNIAGVVGILLGGWLSDRHGRRPVMIWPNLAYLVLILPAFFWIVQSRSALAIIVGTTSLGFLSSMSTGAFYAAVTETLPKAIRGRAFATIYASSIALFGGTTQLVITWLIQVTGNPMAPAFYLMVATVVGQASLWLILESAPVKTLAPPVALDPIPPLA